MSKREVSLTMKKQLVHMKGTKEGLVLRLDDQCAYAELVEELDRKVSEGGIDGKVDVQLHLGYRYLPSEQLHEIQQIIEHSGNMFVKNVHSNVLTKEECEAKVLESQVSTFVGIVRSGQVLQCAGDIVVVGDVNPNGSVEAGGNIYILGKLKGMVHAGINGNRDAIIAASHFEPTHVSIANSIEVMSNEEPFVKENVHELCAYINDKGTITYNRIQEIRNLRPFLNTVKGGS